MSKFLKNKSKADRLEMLSANAQKKESFSYFKQMSEDELQPIKESFFQKHATIDMFEADLIEAKRVYKEATYQVKQLAAEDYKKIQQKGETVNEDVFLIPDYDKGMMDYVNEQGDVVFSRRLLPIENQTQLKVVNS